MWRATAQGHIGSLVPAAGVHVRGVVTVAENAEPDGVTELVDRVPLDPSPTVYPVTRTADDAQDVWTNTKRWARGNHFGAEFVLTDSFQVQFDVSSPLVLKAWGVLLHRFGGEVALVDHARSTARAGPQPGQLAKV